MKIAGKYMNPSLAPKFEFDYRHPRHDFTKGKFDFGTDILKGDTAILGVHPRMAFRSDNEGFNF